MATFKKAKPEQAKLKMSIYGPPGSGKTFTTLLFAEGLAKIDNKRIAYVDSERGTDFYAQEVKSRSLHPNAFDFDALYTRSIADATEAIKSLDPKTHGTVVIDSISHLWDSAMDAFTGKKTKIDTIPMAAWGKIKKPYKDLLNYLIASQFHVFILGRQKNVFEDDDATGQIRKAGVAMRSEGETPYEPHICCRMESRFDIPESTNKPTKDELIGSKNQTSSTYYCYVEKDRTGILSGQTIINPNFKTIMPLLPLLGETQAPIEDEQERIYKDSELMSETESNKEKEKEDKSLNYFNQLQTALFQSKTLDEIGQVVLEIKKVKRYLMESHENALREIYTSQRDKMVAKQAGDLK